MSKFIGLEDLTVAYDSDVYGVGQTYVNEATGKKYVFVYNVGADSWAAGDVVSTATTGLSSCYGSTTAASILDITDGTTVAALVLGVALGTVATTKYAFVQCGGYCSNVTTDTNVSAGTPLLCANGAKVASPATNTHPAAVFMYSDAADSAAVGTGWLTNCRHTWL